MKQLVQRVDVGGHPGHQTADRVAVEEGDRQPLQVAEDLPAQVVHDVLPHELHHVALGVEHDEGEDQRDQVDRRRGREPFGRPRLPGRSRGARSVADTHG